MSPLRYGLSRLGRRALLGLLLWSLPELLPAVLMGIAVARAVDDGFLAGRPLTGVAWLGAVVVASAIGAVGSRQVLRRLGDLVEPVRDDLVQRVVRGALADQTDTGAVTRLARQVEVVRDTFAGLIVVTRAFLVAIVGSVAGLLSLSPRLLVFIVAPALVGLAAFLATLKLSAARIRESVRADERLAATSGMVLSAARDVAATGTSAYAVELAAADITRQAAADRAQAAVSALRTLCYAFAAWVPLLLILLSGRSLVREGLSAGEILGALTYLLAGFQPALSKLMSGLGNSGLKFLVTLERILEVTAVPEAKAKRVKTGATAELSKVTFSYGPHAQPVFTELDLSLKPGDHLAVIGPSGIGKSTLASLLCGLLRPVSGTVTVTGDCVLIPQEAYVFTGKVADNVCYLRQSATFKQSLAAIRAVGAAELVERLGGLAGQITPASLSAGERQLIALTRAYLCRAPIVLLDEATCHLDPVAERTAEEAFMRQGRTLIVIAHRVSSALRAPRVLVLDGVSADLGEHGDLAERSALYRDLMVTSDPAGFLGDADGFDPGAAASLRQHAGKVIANGAVTQEQLRRDGASR